MKEMQLDAAKLPIKNFIQLMNSLQTEYDEQYQGAIDKIAALTNSTPEEIEELDLDEVKALSLALEQLNLKTLTDMIEPLKEITINETKYSVSFLADGKLNFKFVENKFMRDLLNKEGHTEKAFINNLHKFAGVLFKPEGQTKFNLEEMEARADIFWEKMPVEYIYPYIKLITEKLS